MHAEVMPELFDHFRVVNPIHVYPGQCLAVPVLETLFDRGNARFIVLGISVVNDLEMHVFRPLPADIDYRARFETEFLVCSSDPF